MASTMYDRRDGLNDGLAVKAPCRIATTANITLSGLQVVDGITLVADDRVLVKDQDDAIYNGVYNASTGPWRRAKDFDGNRDIVKGTRVLAFAGDDQWTTEYVVTADDPIVIGTTEIDFEEVGGLTVASINGRRYIDVGLYVNSYNGSSSDLLDASGGIAAALAEGEGREVVFTNPAGGTRTYRGLSRSAATFVVPNNCRFINDSFIDFSGIGLPTTSTFKSYFRALGSLGSALTLAVDAAAGENTLTLNDASTVVAGDWLHVSSSTAFATRAQPKGERVRVKSKSSNVVTIYGALKDSYLKDAPASAKVKIVTPWRGSFSGQGRIIGAGRSATDRGDVGIQVEQGVGVKIEGLELINCDYNTIRLLHPVNCIVDHCGIMNSPPGANSNVQYGIVLIGAATNTIIRNNWNLGNRHFWTNVGDSVEGGVARGTLIQGNTIIGTTNAGCATHDEAEDIRYFDNRIIGCDQGLESDCRKTHTRNNRITDFVSGAAGVGISVGSTTEDLRCEGDVIVGGLFGVRLTASDTQLASSRGPTKINLINLELDGQTNTPVQIIYDDTLTVTGVADNGSGLARVTVASTARLRTGDSVIVASVGGATGVNGTSTITVIDATTFDLVGSTFGGSYTSGGTVALVREELKIKGTKVRNSGGVPIYVEGYFKNVSFKDLDVDRASSGGACLQTVGSITDTAVEDVLFGPNCTAPSLASTRLYRRNVRQWGATTLTARTINSGGTLGTATVDFSTVTSNSGTSDTIENLTALAIGTRQTIMATSGHTITVAHISGGTGNIRLAGGADRVLSGNAAIELTCDGTNWLEVGASAQPLSANLSAISGNTSAANKISYWTGSGTSAVTDFTAAGRSMVGAADAAAQAALLNSSIAPVFSNITSKPTTISGYGITDGASKTSQTFTDTVLILFPDNRDYPVWRNVANARTITKVTTKSSSGTCTVTGKIGTTALGGTANSAASTEEVQAQPSANVMAVGDDFKLTVSSNSSCLDLEVSIEYTRALS